VTGEEFTYLCLIEMNIYWEMAEKSTACKFIGHNLFCSSEICFQLFALF
jgi:hypothetical protein